MNESATLSDIFERMWADGSSPELGEFLSAVGAVDADELSQLARIDQKERWQRGERRLVEEYLEQFPSLQADHDCAVDLIYHEFLMRERFLGQSTPDEYTRRFPQHAAALAEQIGLHQALSDALEMAGGSALSTTDTVAVPKEARRELPLLPAKFGRYRLLELLGHGAMGTVYAAEDTKLGRQVALKLPRFDRVESPEAVDRFRREARIAATFHHPHLCPVYDFGERDGMLYLTMPRLTGQSLAARLQEGALPASQACRIALRIARAMAVAHEAGVVHRDLKPSNVLLRENGEPVVMDFGLARRDLELDRPQPESSALVGTLAYMAPEQLHSTSDAACPASDIYSLGVILYEMLTGRRPFDGGWQEVWDQIRTQQPVPPSQYVPNLSPGLSDVCMRAMAKDSRERFKSMEALADALVPYAERIGAAPGERDWGESSNAQHRAAVATAVARRNRRMVAVLVATTVLIAGGWLAWRAYVRQWALQQVATIEGLAHERKFFEAYDLAQSVRSYLPGNSKLARLMPVISSVLSVTSEPEGAEVYLTRYHEGAEKDHSQSEFVGITPIPEVVIGRGDYLLSVRKEGYVPFRRTWSGMAIIGVEAPVDLTLRQLEMKLTRVKDDRPGMVFVPAREYRLQALRRPTDAEVKLDDYWIDRCEVTNREYKEFVDDGGYDDVRYWHHPFVYEGRTITREEAMRLFVDDTGRAGPRGWSNQNFPRGKGEHPVTRITWYEAAAYASYRGKSLPTIFQWENAARFKWKGRGFINFNNPLGVTMPWGLHEGETLGRANLSTSGTVPVGELDFGMSPYGCYEMAGNAAEWCLNETSQGFIASGGSWASLPQAWGYFGIYPALHESSEIGFRCVLNTSGATGDQGAMWINIDEEVPRYARAPESEVKKWHSYYNYDRQAPLDARIVEVKETDEWRREKIDYIGAEGERVLAYLYLPRQIAGPCQVVQFVPAGDVSYRIRTVPQSIEADYIELVRSGRAVLTVVLRNYLERYSPATETDPEPGSVEQVEKKARDVVDMRRGIDYLETRHDIDMSHVAYMTVSRAGIIMALPALESRISATIFVGDTIGKWDMQNHPATSAVNFAPLIGGPKLMVHGKYDESAPLKTVAEPLYDLLTGPKKKVLFDGGHRPEPEFLMPVVNSWLDMTFGPTTTVVARRSET